MKTTNTLFRLSTSELYLSQRCALFSPFDRALNKTLSSKTVPRFCQPACTSRFETQRRHSRHCRLPRVQDGPVSHLGRSRRQKIARGIVSTRRSHPVSDLPPPRKAKSSQCARRDGVDEGDEDEDSPLPTNALFLAPPEAWTALLPEHIQDAFARMQGDWAHHRSAGMRNWRGGLVRTRVSLIWTWGVLRVCMLDSIFCFLLSLYVHSRIECV